MQVRRLQMLCGLSQIIHLGRVKLWIERAVISLRSVPAFARYVVKTKTGAGRISRMGYVLLFHSEIEAAPIFTQACVNKKATASLGHLQVSCITSPRFDDFVELDASHVDLFEMRRDAEHVLVFFVFGNVGAR